MYKQYFGKRRRMRFDSQNEYYETLGFFGKIRWLNYIGMGKQ